MLRNFLSPEWEPCHCSSVLVTSSTDLRLAALIRIGCSWIVLNRTEKAEAYVQAGPGTCHWLRVTCWLQVLDACLKEIVTALLQADVNVKLVMNLRTNVKVRANNADKGAGLNKRKIIEKAVVDELSNMLSSGLDEKQLVDLKKGKPNVVMFVGLQASSALPRLPWCCR